MENLGKSNGRFGQKQWENWGKSNEKTRKAAANNNNNNDKFLYSAIYSYKLLRALAALSRNIYNTIQLTFSTFFP